MTEASTITREERGSILVATINRPEVLNALNSTVLDDLSDLVAEFEHDDSKSILVLTGAGKAFVAGADISEMEHMTPQEAKLFSDHGQDLLSAVSSMDKLVVAAVNGFALGGGCELALGCDLIYASEKAKFGQPEVKLGVIPGFGGTQRLARAVGVRHAIELISSGRIISSQEALDIGMLNKVLPTENFLDAVCEELKPILANGPRAVGAAKLAIYRGQDLPIERALSLETEMFANLFSTEEQKEGMQAFLQKRPANFSL